MKSTALLDHHTSPPSNKVSKASLPISRPANILGYERSERARTSHACEPCRERKTKCDGERPSCRRCLHTGTGCHYGYGKGWRKRKTAEDLNQTSKKLQRYESLLNDIIPMVTPEVRAMIDEVRQQETSANSTSEAADSASSMASLTPTLSSEQDRSGSVPNGRLPLTLPIPGSLVSSQSRSQPLSFDRVSESTSPHLAHHPKREAAFDEASNSRLPSITPHGVLIENGGTATSPGYPQAPSTAGLMVTEHISPTTGSSSGTVGLAKHADDWARLNSPPTLRMNDSEYPFQSHALLPNHVTA